MSRFYSYLNTASTLISQFDGTMPLAIFLKQFFAREKKFGSKDRKQISSLIYNFYRVASAIVDSTLEEKLLIAIFLTENTSNQILELLNPTLNEKISNSLAEKFEFLGDKIVISKLFPFENELSEVINKEIFRESVLIQPNLFLRIRPNKQEKVFKILTEANLQFKEIKPNTLSLTNGSKIPEGLIIDKDYVVQDASSQQIGEIFKPHLATLKGDINLWDCCAASGGKSIMLFDQNPNFNLFVSDIRASILVNLQERFQSAGIKKYTKFVADLTEKHLALPQYKFDVIIADVPCTGSGTWARTPEQMYYFKASQIEDYALRQKEIAFNALQYLENNGLLVYITCSIFKKENEEVVNQLINKGLELLTQETVQGFEHKADSLFVAVLKKV